MIRVLFRHCEAFLEIQIFNYLGCLGIVWLLAWMCVAIVRGTSVYWTGESFLNACEGKRWTNIDIPSSGSPFFSVFRSISILQGIMQSTFNEVLMSLPQIQIQTATIQHHWSLHFASDKFNTFWRCALYVTIMWRLIQISACHRRYTQCKEL